MQKSKLQLTNQNYLGARRYRARNRYPLASHTRKRFGRGAQALQEGNLKARLGFTLVELLVVITIIGLLVSLGVMSYQTANRKARDGRRKSDLEQIRTALEIYKSDNGTYPQTAWVSSADGDDWIPGLEPDYIEQLPSDPKPGEVSEPWLEGGYNYAYYSDTLGGATPGREYILVARMEASDGQSNIYSGTTWEGDERTYAVGEP